MIFFLGDLGESVQNIKVLGEPTELTNKVGRFQGKPSILVINISPDSLGGDAPYFDPNFNRNASF
jgi:hypothetical protein